MGLLPAPHVCVDRGSIDFLGEEITSITDEDLGMSEVMKFQ